MKPNLYVLFMSYLRNPCLSHRSHDFSLKFSSRTFIVFIFNLRSVIHFELTFVHGAMYELGFITLHGCIWLQKCKDLCLSNVSIFSFVDFPQPLYLESPHHNVRQNFTCIFLWFLKLKYISNLFFQKQSPLFEGSIITNNSLKAPYLILVAFAQVSFCCCYPYWVFFPCKSSLVGLISYLHSGIYAYP